MEKSIVASIRFKGKLNEKRIIEFLTESFSTYGLFFKYLNYSLVDKSKRNWKLINKSYEFNSKNVESLRELLSQSSGKVELRFELITNTVDSEFKSRDIQYSAHYNQYDEINSINLIIDRVVFNSDLGSRIEPLLFSMVKYIENEGGEVVYGFVYSLQNNKFPVLYTEGISSENTTPIENDRLSTWLREMEICDRKVWNIFWLNFLSRVHLKDVSILNEVKKIIGTEKVNQVSEKLFCFALNESLEDFNVLTLTNERQKLLRLFEKHDLIM